MASQQPIRKGFFTQVPGFRSGTRLKQIVAIIGYLVIAGWVLQVATNLALAVFGALVLFAVLLITNGWDLRKRIPPFSAPNFGIAFIGWAGLGVALLIALSLGVAAQQPSSPRTTPKTAVQTTATASPTPTPKPTPTPTPKPTSTPTPTPTPTPAPPTPVPVVNTCGAPQNPYGYTFCGGSFIYSPAADFCSYFSCIGNFGNSPGYVVECRDAMFATSGGRRGSCSQHGGDLRPLYMR